MGGKKPILAAALALALMALTLAAARWGGGPGLSYPETLPGGYRVARVVSGPEALEMAKSIHWNPSAIEITKAVIVVYTDGTRLWITETKGDACRYAEQMAEKIAIYSEQLPYTPPIPHEIEGVKVYLTLDKRNGRLHAFWCRDSIIAWAELGESGIQGLKRLIETVGKQ